MVCGYGSYRSENSVVKSISLNPKHPFHGVSLNQLILSFFARHAFHISVPNPPYRFEYGSAFADPYRIRILLLIFSSVAFKMRTKNKVLKKFSLLITFRRYIYIRFRIRSRTYKYGSGSEGPKDFRIRNIAFHVPVQVTLVLSFIPAASGCYVWSSNRPDIIRISETAEPCSSSAVS
jgi:hypothetical protein